ncbi:uncharacterized protein LOC101857383 isoform X1 [Aplysia californica]|uniref:Uncharacterized protein LOC101857383 isoform X1 n=1 Tax=Aplysia californica TaxID=6500 RepID=A0ABM1A9A4_APLCA|nr:uncharacterized protein LOC101857383 isoform X1 [Aplysia californica]
MLQIVDIICLYAIIFNFVIIKTLVPFKMENIVKKQWSVMLLLVLLTLTSSMALPARLSRASGGVREARSASSSDVSDESPKGRHNIGDVCPKGTTEEIFDDEEGGIVAYCLPDLLDTVYSSSFGMPQFSPRKMWFARKLYHQLHFGGQLSDRQIKYAADSGFKSVVSIFEHDATFDNLGKQLTPSSEEERRLVEDVAGMKYFELLPKGQGGDWFKVSSVEKMTRVYEQLEFPALLHCQRGVSVVFLTLMYYANQTIHDPNFEPKVDIRSFYSITRKLGLDFLSTFKVATQTVEMITGEEVPESARSPSVSLANWFNFWPGFPVYNNWFITGQINANMVSQIKAQGFVTVVNVRKNVTTELGKPSQESVELINIISGTPTYGNSTFPSRQSPSGLQRSIIDQSRPEDYVSSSAAANYESSNAEEFGDSVGYNQERERTAVIAAGLEYKNLPLDKMKDFATFIKENMDQLIEISKKGPVLVHCARGYRAAMVAVLASAVQYDLTIDWALQRLKEMGMGISAESHPHIYDVYKELLPSRQRVEL